MKKQLLIDVLFLYLLCCIIDKTVIFCIYHRYQMLCTVSLVHNSIWPTNYIIISLQMDGSLALAPYMKIVWIEYDMSKKWRIYAFIWIEFGLYFSTWCTHSMFSFETRQNNNLVPFLHQLILLLSILWLLFLKISFPPSIF